MKMQPKFPPITPGVIANGIVIAGRSANYLDYQVWEISEKPSKIRIHKLGHRDHEDPNNVFDSFQRAHEEIYRRHQERRKR